MIQRLGHGFDVLVGHDWASVTERRATNEDPYGFGPPFFKPRDSVVDRTPARQPDANAVETLTDETPVSRGAHPRRIGQRTGHSAARIHV